MPRRTRLSLIVITALALVGAASPLHAGAVSIPNASFESPVFRVAPYATPNVSDWQKAAAPWWWTQSEQDWLSVAGVFYNVPGSSHIDNVDGEQAAFLFSMPGVELYQDLAATYETGQSYTLSMKAQGGGMGMPLGTPLEIRLYYRDGNGERVTLGTREILNLTDESVPHPMLLDEYQLQLPPVPAGAAWAGKPIGVQIVATVTSPVPGGFWRLDDVQLTSVPEPASAALLAAGVILLARRRARSKANT